MLRLTLSQLVTIAAALVIMWAAVAWLRCQIKSCT
jgi:hypothetical protein